MTIRGNIIWGDSLDERKLGKQINKAIRRKIYEKFKRRALVIQPKVANLFEQYIQNTNEWASLLDTDSEGSLGVELGLRGNEIRLWLAKILEVWKQSITVKVLPPRISRGVLYMQMDIRGIRSDYSDVLTQPYAMYVSINGLEIPWLRWLLLEADQVRIPGYSIKYKPGAKGSRSGDALMEPDPQGFWQMPTEFRLPEEENFVSRVTGSREFQNEYGRHYNRGVQSRRRRRLLERARGANLFR